MAVVAPMPRIATRRLVAIHEAGHAAMSLLLGQGHQDGVTIIASGQYAGRHAVGRQFSLEHLPRPIALREAIKDVFVSLAGPMAQTSANGDVFDLDDFLAEAEPGSDAAHVCTGLGVIEHLLGRDERVLLVQVVTDLLSRAAVDALIQAVATALIRRGRIGEEGLALIHNRHPTDPEWIRLPTTMTEEWLN